jgi:hypothetical protein
MTYRFIDEHRSQWPVRLLCETLAVPPACYYAWRQRPYSCRQQRYDALLVESRSIHAEVKTRYGSPRIHAELVGLPLCSAAALYYSQSVKSLINKSFISSYVLSAVIEKVHDLIRISNNSGDEEIDPAGVLKELQEGLAEASQLARELSPRNFAPEELDSKVKR